MPIKCTWLIWVPDLSARRKATKALPPNMAGHLLSTLWNTWMSLWMPSNSDPSTALVKMETWIPWAQAAKANCPVVLRVWPSASSKQTSNTCFTLMGLNISTFSNYTSLASGHVCLTAHAPPIANLSCRWGLRVSLHCNKYSPASPCRLWPYCPWCGCAIFYFENRPWI